MQDTASANQTQSIIPLQSKQTESMISQTVVHQHPDDDDHSDTSDSDSDEDSNQETPNLPKAASGEDSVEESENDDFEDGDDESSTSTSHKPPPDKLMKRNPKK
jgi:hypothetical protein